MRNRSAVDTAKYGFAKGASVADQTVRLGGVFADISAWSAGSGVDVEGLGIVVIAGTDLVVTPPGEGILTDTGEVIEGDSS
jgi:hypothetical protein